MYSTRNSILVTLLFTTALFGASPAITEKHPAPEGFDRFAVYMAAGRFDPASPHPEVPGCFMTFCDGYYFQERVMNWDPAEIAAADAAAADFFQQRFGLDVETLAAEGRIAYRSFFFDPRTEYRLYHLAGARVPPEGWLVRDGGYLVTVLDPAGIELGGERAGEHAPSGSFLAFGHYNVQTTLPNGKPREEIVIRYQSVTPVAPLADGSVHFRCELIHPDWGSGLAQGVMANVVLPDGRLQLNIRNVLTFPGLGH